MTMLAHPRTDGYGRSERARNAAAVLDRAIREARSHLPSRRGIMRRLMGSRTSAAAVIRRYRLRGAIDAAYERVVRELGPVRVEISAEQSAGEPYVAVDCFAPGADVDRVLEVEDAVQREAHAALGDRRWLRLLLSVNPAPAEERSA